MSNPTRFKEGGQQTECFLPANGVPTAQLCLRGGCLVLRGHSRPGPALHHTSTDSLLTPYLPGLLLEPCPQLLGTPPDPTQKQDPVPLSHSVSVQFRYNAEIREMGGLQQRGPRKLAPPAGRSNQGDQIAQTRKEQGEPRVREENSVQEAAR